MGAAIFSPVEGGGTIPPSLLPVGAWVVDFAAVLVLLGSNISLVLQRDSTSRFANSGLL